MVSIYNEDILDKLYEWSIDTEFYLRNRYILENVVNNEKIQEKEKSSLKKVKKNIKDITEKYDAVYVNGEGLKNLQKSSHIIKEGLKK